MSKQEKIKVISISFLSSLVINLIFQLLLN